MCKFVRVSFVISLLHIATSAVASSHLSTGWKNTSWNFLMSDDRYLKQHNSENIFTGEKSHVVAYALLSNDTFDYPSFYNLTVIAHAFDDQFSIKSCALNTTSTQGSATTDRMRRVVVLRENRILVIWSKESGNNQDATLVSQVIYLESCQSSNYIYTGKGAFPWVFLYKDTFDMVFNNTEICSEDAYCKFSFNYDGDSLQSDSRTLPSLTSNDGYELFIRKAYAMNYGSGEGIVLIANRRDQEQLSEDVFASSVGWIKTPQLNFRFSWYSNSSGFASLCWRINYWEDLYCQRLDGTRDKNAYKFDMNFMSATVIKLHNKPNGQFLFLSERGSRDLIIDEAYDNGRCKRIETIEDISSIEKVEIIIIGEKRYCLSMITKDAIDIDEQERVTIKYDFVTKCINMPDLSSANYIPCAARKP